jgi:hypothetical protein
VELLCELDFVLRLPHVRFALRVGQVEEVVQERLLPPHPELLAGVLCMRPSSW